MDLTWMRKGQSMNLIWRANQSAAWTLLDWQLNKSVAGIAESCSFILNLRAIEEFLNDAVKVLTMERSCFNSECLAYSWNDVINSQHILQPNDIQAAKIQSTSLLMEIGVPSFPPEVDVGILDYSVTGRYTHNLRTDTFRYEGKVSHPALARDVTAVVEYTISGTSQRGSFELDIFPDTADKITGSLVSILLANNTVRLETNLTTRVGYFFTVNSYMKKNIYTYVSIYLLSIHLFRY